MWRLLLRKDRHINGPNISRKFWVQTVFFLHSCQRQEIRSHSRISRAVYFLHGDSDMDQIFLTRLWREIEIFFLGVGDAVPSQNSPFSSIINMHQLQKPSYG
jgi:hypothetical protein